MPRGLARYRLSTTAFDGDRLNPLEDMEHAKRFIEVGGYQNLGKLDQQLTAAIEANAACFFLVVGRRGAGRTAIANHILARYRHLQGIPAERFLVPDHEVENHSDFDVMTNWLVKLEDLLRERVANVPSATLEDVATALGSDARIYRARFAGVLRRLARQLADLQPQAAFGVRLERVPSHGLVAAAFEIFSMIPTAVVFTAFDHDSAAQDVIHPFNGCLAARQELPVRSDAVVYLQLLAGADARHAIEARWRYYHDTVASPFDGPGLEQAFRRQQRPIGRVLRLARRALEMQAADEGGEWPDAPELAVSGARMETIVEGLDSERD